MQTKNITDFKAGKLVQKIEYKSFMPETICHQWLLTKPELVQLLSEADRNLGKLDAFADLIPDVDFL